MTILPNFTEKFGENFRKSQEEKFYFQEHLKPVPLADFIIRDGYPDPKGRTVVDNKAETEVRIAIENKVKSGR